MRFSRDGQRFAAYQIDGEVRVWRTDAWKLAGIVPSRSSFGAVHHGRVVFPSSYDRIAIGWGNGKVSLHEADTGKLLSEFSAHADGITALAAAPTSAVLATAMDGSVRLWQVPPPERPPPLQVLREPCGYFAISPDSRRLATVGDDYSLWDLDSGEKLATLTELRGFQATCDFSPDGRQLVVGGRNGKIRTWDFGRNSLTEFDTGSGEDVSGVKTLGVTNFLVALNNRDGHFKIWDFQTHQLVHEFEPFRPGDQKRQPFPQGRHRHRPRRWQRDAMEC